MSMTLNLFDHLLARGRNLHKLGREHDALRLLHRLADFRELPPAVAEETQSRLADILLRRRRYKQARRHLTAALTQQPANARYHRLMAAALSGDDRMDPQRALEHYRKALEIDPDQPRCLAEFGLLAVRLGQVDEGLASLCRAVDVAPDDPEVVAALVRGLRQADRIDEARQVVKAAMFRNPRDGRFRQLWDNLQFELLHEEQDTLRRAHRAGDEDEEGPVLLPFVKPAPGSVPPSFGKKRVRRDGPSPLPPPHVPGPTHVPDRKRA
jgi:tetratricopeptide (TPR) repeat protein